MGRRTSLRLVVGGAATDIGTEVEHNDAVQTWRQLRRARPVGKLQERKSQ